MKSLTAADTVLLQTISKRLQVFNGDTDGHVSPFARSNDSVSEFNSFAPAKLELAANWLAIIGELNRDHCSATLKVRAARAVPAQADTSGESSRACSGIDWLRLGSFCCLVSVVGS